MSRIQLIFLAAAAMASLVMAAGVQSTPSLLSADRRAQAYGLSQLLSQSDAALSR